MQVWDVEPATIKVGTLATRNHLLTRHGAPRSHSLFRVQTWDKVSNQTRQGDLASQGEKGQAIGRDLPEWRRPS